MLEKILHFPYCELVMILKELILFGLRVKKLARRSWGTSRMDMERRRS